MAHAATHTDTTVTNAGGKQTIWDKTLANGNSPIEWVFTTDVDVDLFISGAYPGGDTAITITGGSEYRFASLNRGIDLIEVEPDGSDASISLLPSIL